MEIRSKGKVAEGRVWRPPLGRERRFKNRRSRPRGGLHTLPSATFPFERISIDHIGPLPKSNGYNAILVVVDFFMKFKILVACHTTDDSPAFVQSYLTYVFPYF